jgi:hypothetical protein
VRSLGAPGPELEAIRLEAVAYRRAVPSDRIFVENPGAGGGLGSENLRVWGTITMHRLYRLLRVYRTTARTRDELAQVYARHVVHGRSSSRTMARGRGVSQGWVPRLVMAQQRGASARGLPRRLVSGVISILHDDFSLARIIDKGHPRAFKRTDRQRFSGARVRSASSV